MSTPPAQDLPCGADGPHLSQLVIATGNSVAAGQVDHLNYYQAPLQVTWPARVGRVPGLASAFQDRAGIRERVQAARSQFGQVALSQVLVGGGGVGKSQLAAHCAHAATEEGTDLVVWVDASTASAVIGTFARAAVRVQAPGATANDAEADARAFLDWAATTPRTWLVVLDDITDPAALSPWWPASRSSAGWVLATTRRRDAALSGGGRVVIDVGTYTRAESLAYLAERLVGAGRPGLLDEQAGELASELGDLPLGLSHAAAYMLDQQIGCGAYLDRYRAGRDRLDDLMPTTADADGYGRTVTATLLLALDAADACPPAGLARPAIRLAALLDPVGHPYHLWATDAATSYLFAASGGMRPSPVTPAQARDVLTLLHRYALADFDSQGGPRAVRLHALIARAARETTPASHRPVIARAAADALSAIWPANDQSSPTLAASLRANASHAGAHAADALWNPDAHPLLFHTGNSLLNAGLYEAAITFWCSVAADASRLLGPEHPKTLTARGSLATSCYQAGRTADAIAIQEQVAADSARVLGAEHRETLTAQGNLALSYNRAGRMADAIAIEEPLAADFARLLGSEHDATLRARGNLAASYQQAGRTADAIAIQEQVAADSARLFGPGHPDTLCARGNLAQSYHQAGRTADAIAIEEQVAADRVQLLGEYPDTLVARGNLALSYRQAGRMADAIAIEEPLAADFARFLGPEHPYTLRAQGNLAASYFQAGRTADAIAIEEQVAADSARLFGPEHPDTLRALDNLAQFYLQAGRSAEATIIQEQVAADSARLFGAEHPDTLRARSNLAASYFQAGRSAEAIVIQEQVAADAVRLLGPEHPATLTVRGNLARSYRQIGQTADAIAIEGGRAWDQASAGRVVTAFGLRWGKTNLIMRSWAAGTPPPLPTTTCMDLPGRCHQFGQGHGLGFGDELLAGCPRRHQPGTEPRA